MRQAGRIFFVLLFLVTLLPLHALEIREGRIKLVLHEDIGRYSVYYLQDKALGKYTSLLVDQDPRTSTISVVISNKLYSLGDSSSFTEKIQKTSTGAEIIWVSEEVEIVEKFTFVQSLLSTETDGVQVTLTFRNLSTKDLKIGSRLIFDTYMGEDSSDHFKTDTLPQISKEYSMDEEDMARYWVSQTSPEMGMMVMTRGQGITIPDKVVFSNWKRMNETAWTYNVSTSRNFNLPPYSINDSAVSHYYYPEIVYSGFSREVTYIIGKYSEAGFLFSEKGTTDATPTTTSSSTPQPTSVVSGPTPTPMIIISTPPPDLSSNVSVQMESIRGDITSLETLIGEIDKNLNSSQVSEAEIVMIEALLKELKSKMENYK